MPAIRLSMDGVTEQQRDIDLSRKARFKELIYRLGATARWKISFFVLLTLVIFRMMDGLGEAAPNLLVAFPKTRNEGQTAPPPPRLGPVLAYMGHMRRLGGGAPITRSLALRPTMHESSSQFTFHVRQTSSTRPIDDKTRIDLGCFDATKPILDYSPLG